MFKKIKHFYKKMISKFLIVVKTFKILKKTISYLKKNNISFYIFEAPDIKKIKGLTEEEIDILNKDLTSGQLLNDIDYLKKAYGDQNDCYEFARTRYKGTHLIDNGVYIQSADYTGKYYNVKNGIRSTTNQPKNSKHSIHIFGSCIARGFGVSDTYTIPSILQRKINEIFEDTFRVVNYGTGGKATLEGLINDLTFIQCCNFRENDIIILLTFKTLISRPIKKIFARSSFFETSQQFDRPHNYGWWFLNSTIHLNQIGNEVISDYIYHCIEKQLFLSSKQEKRSAIKPLKKMKSFYDSNKDLKRYIENIKKYQVESNHKKIGAIVMNCNPFTLGHRYLIDTAMKQVDYLYLFVVEENKSFFSFEDRFQMVVQGVIDLPNVNVLPSGNFIISSLTFPEYFQKEEIKDIKIDATNDLRIFGEVIAPTLNITVRFAGEEPLDPITNQYNEAMSEQLKFYGIEFISIPRKNCNNEVISASRVRSLIKNESLEDISSLVPKSTLTVLQKYMKQSPKQA